jgi:hypothetical protein
VIAYLGSTGFSLSGDAGELDVRLATLLRANGQLALGDMVRQAMSDHISQDLPFYPVWVYNLLGDPALQYNVARTLSPLQVSAITPGSLSWSGGLPPYQLQITTNLTSPAAWQPLGGPLMGYNVRLTNSGPRGFIRVQAAQ